MSTSHLPHDELRILPLPGAPDGLRRAARVGAVARAIPVPGRVAEAPVPVETPVDIANVFEGEMRRWAFTEDGSCESEFKKRCEALVGYTLRTGKQFQQEIAKGVVLSGIPRILSDNSTLIRVALQEARTGMENADKLPRVEDSAGKKRVPRAYAVARAYLKAAGDELDGAGLVRIMDVAQREMPFQTAEVWSLKPFLELAILEDIAEVPVEFAPRAAQTKADASAAAADPTYARLALRVKSLKALLDLDWKSIFSQINFTERVLRQDPAQAFSRMDWESRESYRNAICEMAAHSDRSEPSIAAAAIALARVAAENSAATDRESQRHAHVGYYLIDAGQKSLRETIGYRYSLAERIRRGILQSPDFFYLVGIEVVALCVMAAVVSFSRARLPGFLVAALFLIPAVECAVSTMNLLAARFVRPKRLPKLDFSAGIPANCKTMVVIPTLLSSEQQVQHAVHDLEVRFLANRDANLHFALLTDPPDSSVQFDDKDALAGVCAKMIDALNAKYAPENKGSFFLFHRHRAYNAPEGIWMGWERKRGKLLDFNRLLLDQGDNFPVKTGNLTLLAGVKYVITLDLDTQLPRDAAHRLIGTIAHPLNRAVIDPARNIVVEGYGILQPRVDISIKSASRSRLSALLSGDAGFDIYTRAVSDIYQDLFGEGIFTGKGIYEVEPFQTVLEHRFPCNAILSHDLIEGAYARAGLVSDVEVVDDYPSHLRAFSRRKHRWVRGDWQIIFWLLPRVPDYFGKMVRNPISDISRWKIIDNLRRSVTELATLVLLVSGWLFLPGKALYWTLAALAVFLFPTYFQFAFSIATAGSAIFKRSFWSSLLSDFAAAHAKLLFRMAFLCHQSMLTLDAVVRTIVRMTLTRKRLLEWETAADAEQETETKHLVDSYLSRSVALSFLIGALVAVSHPASLVIALPFLALWASSKWIAEWLNQPRQAGVSPMQARDRALLRNSALRAWRFFREFSTAGENWLVPDIVQEDPFMVAHRVSTTNLGLLLNARLAAYDMGYLTLDEFAHDTEKTLAAVQKMETCHGHLYNWYDTQTLQPVKPLFVSTVDNGNLLCSLWTLKQGCLEAMRQPLLKRTFWQGIQDHVDLLQDIAAAGRRNSKMNAAIRDLRQRLGSIRDLDASWPEALATLEMDVTIFSKKMADCGAPAEIDWWTRELAERVSRLTRMSDDFAPWLSPRFAEIRAMVDRAALPRVSSLSLESAPAQFARLDEALAALLENSAEVETPNGGLLQSLRAAIARSAAICRQLSERLGGLATASDSMANAMDFSVVYNAKKKQISIGYDGELQEASTYHYDLLASEARAAVFGGVAKGEIPQECWFQLDRTHTGLLGEHALISWTGTMFEYLMPALWMKSYPGTMLESSARAAVQVQRKFADSKSIPWGISESSCWQKNPDGHYRYHAFGVPGLAINRDDCSNDLVISPYSSFLALLVDARDAVKNIRWMRRLGWISAYGFYEAADFTPSRVGGRKGRHEIVKSWMAHHQGMSLLAVADVLCDSAMQRRFHAEPRVIATERLLHEKAPAPGAMKVSAAMAKYSWKSLMAKTPLFLRREYWNSSPDLRHGLAHPH
jgi:hypothetical protein